ncbi:MAG TPA: hypothetical protein PK537_09555 [Candidatus Limiplasma sp.]|nr:hypothetical protein [Candidatus Limiplasma sp.]
MKNKITFREFQVHMQGFGYSDNEIKHLFGAVKALDSETRGWMIRWFWDGEFPTKEIEGVTFRYLVNDFGYKPLNAFIVLDWLKSNPDAAKYFVLLKPADTPPGEKVGNEMVEILKQNGRTPTPLYQDDILEDIQA